MKADLENHPILSCIPSFKKEDVIITINGEVKECTKFDYDIELDGYRFDYKQ